jgi:hypothetical protein
MYRWATHLNILGCFCVLAQKIQKGQQGIAEPL